MYIRTKDGRIAEVKENMTIKRCSENVLRLVYKDNRSICVLSGNDDIIKQSETIEELCDEFILEEKMREVIYHHKSTKFDDFKTIAILNERYTLYGAIWTDKGLIYVSRMNDKGDLELI